MAQAKERTDGWVARHESTAATSRLTTAESSGGAWSGADLASGAHLHDGVTIQDPLSEVCDCL